MGSHSGDESDSEQGIDFQVGGSHSDVINVRINPEPCVFWVPCANMALVNNLADEFFDAEDIPDGEGLYLSSNDDDLPLGGNLYPGPLQHE